MWAEGKVRIVDIANEVGVSTATVSNVIHGKTKKISAQTVKRVQESWRNAAISPIWPLRSWRRTTPGSSAWSSMIMKSMKAGR